MSQSSTEPHRTQSGSTTTKISEITRRQEFEKDLKALRKRFRSLDDDIERFVAAALLPFHEQGIDAGVMEQISGLGITEPKIFKVVKFACLSMKGKGNRSGIRMTYAFFEKTGKVEFIEIYYKGDKENEDRDRIMRYYGGPTVRESIEVYEVER